ncbi:MAG: HAMP domain-containing histidine kinase [Prolixibacteraceae bacterium]|jgi:signal transduction histidine kinase|nr:HAMP domain-containing histidine kinase [Prolixibacteraceae bacterium]
MPEPNGNIVSRNLLLLVALLALGCSFCLGPLLFSGSDRKADGERIFRVFEGKERIIRAEMEKIAIKLSSGNDGMELWEGVEEMEQAGKGLFYTVSERDSLLYWSSSLVAFDHQNEQIKPEGNLVKMPTGWFFLFSKQKDQFTIKGYMLIKRDFPYQNRYVQSSFQQDFHLPDQCEVVPSPRPGNIQVFCHEGKFHFGIQYKNKPNGTSQEEVPSFLFFMLFVVLFTAQFHNWIFARSLNPFSKFALCTLFAALFYLTLNYFKLPHAVYEGKLFTPFHFAWGRVLSSLGEYLLVSFFLFFVAQSFFTIFRKQRNAGILNKSNLFFFLFAGGYFAGSTGLFLLLLNNSDISLELYANYMISIPNILATGCIALQMIGFAVILLRIKCTVAREKKLISFFLPGMLSFAIIWLLLFLQGWQIPVVANVFYMIVLFLIDRIGTDLLSRYKLTSLLVYGLLLAFGLNLVARKESERRRADILKVMAVTLATERDPAAEIFLTEFESKIAKDSLIQVLTTPPYQKLQSYLKENYFTGFWNNYELQVTVCAASDSVYLPDERLKFPCFDFFNQLKQSKGVILPGSDFYFMDRLNGRISYLGELHMFNQQNKKPIIAFIELNSKIIPEGKGYPQLLMDQQASRRNRNDGYSYAKYFDNKLVDRGGSYLYDPGIDHTEKLQKEFNYYEQNGFLHCIYKRSGANYVVVSYPLSSWIDKGRGFPTLFLFIYLLGFCWIIVSQRTKVIPRNRLELRGKIQFTLVSTLLVLLFLIGWGLIKYNYLEFQRTLKENLDQKVRAISAELGLRVGHSVRLDAIHDYLGEQLSEISDITWTDINLYDLKGKLAASSRNEIFDQGLTSERMDPVAYQALHIQGNQAFLHNENLGKMEFFSVYAPLFNQNDDLVGYVNLPYFNRQDEFTRQVTGFIVAFLNLYILLVLLTMVIALAISTRLTVPLLLIEQKLKGIALGKQNAIIEYHGEDEIGRLVEAYNKKVAELADSAALLARSERESAWKEMARQIAHEINNPLTPMKLNIQYLQKIKDEEAPNFDDYFDRVTRMLVAQIDALSSIAATFSDFAKMPSPRIDRVEMVELIREVVTLFYSPEEYQLSVNYPDQSVVFILGVREQLTRAFVNVIRNAVQAIQHRDDGEIRITAELVEHKLLISIQDNGPGIHEADQDRLFEPSFTTKSGGMGLGLAISKSILENCNGEISFQSAPGKTIFCMEFPVR